MADLIVGHQTLAVAGTAVSLTVPTPSAGSVTRARISVKTADIRWAADGTTTPTASDGEPEAAGTTFWLEGETNLANFKAIRVSSTSAELNIVYFRDQP